MRTEAVLKEGKKIKIEAMFNKCIYRDIDRHIDKQIYFQDSDLSMAFDSVPLAVPDEKILSNPWKSARSDSKS